MRSVGLRCFLDSEVSKRSTPKKCAATCASVIKLLLVLYKRDWSLYHTFLPTENGIRSLHRRTIDKVRWFTKYGREQRQSTSNGQHQVSTRSGLDAALSDHDCVMHKTMTGSPSCEFAKSPESAGIDVDSATAFHSTVLAATAVQNAQESQAVGMELVKDEKKAMKLESVAGQSSLNICNEIATVLGNLGVVTRAEVTEIVKSRMVKTRARPMLSIPLRTRLKTLFSRLIRT